jgi:hypothetical protein
MGDSVIEKQRVFENGKPHRHNRCPMLMHDPPFGNLSLGPRRFFWRRRCCYFGRRPAGPALPATVELFL